MAEITRLQAAIVQTNAEHAAPFWEAMGYQPVGLHRPHEQGSVHTTVRL